MILNYLTTAEDDLYFDRKSSKIEARKLADIIASFANSNGRTILVMLCYSWALLTRNSWKIMR